MIAGLFPLPSYDDLWEQIDSLIYHQYGGSGFMITHSEVMRLPYERFLFMLRHLGEMREDESRRIKAAGRSLKGDEPRDTL